MGLWNTSASTLSGSYPHPGTRASSQAARTPGVAKVKEMARSEDGQPLALLRSLPGSALVSVAVPWRDGDGSADSEVLRDITERCWGAGACDGKANANRYSSPALQTPVVLRGRSWHQVALTGRYYQRIEPGIGAPSRTGEHSRSSERSIAAGDTTLDWVRPQPSQADTRSAVRVAFTATMWSRVDGITAHNTCGEGKG